MPIVSLCSFGARSDNFFFLFPLAGVLEEEYNDLFFQLPFSSFRPSHVGKGRKKKKNQYREKK